MSQNARMAGVHNHSRTPLCEDAVTRGRTWDKGRGASSVNGPKNVRGAKCSHSGHIDIEAAGTGTGLVIS